MAVRDSQDVEGPRVVRTAQEQEGVTLVEVVCCCAGEAGPPEVVEADRLEVVSAGPGISYLKLPQRIVMRCLDRGTVAGIGRLQPDLIRR